VADRSVSVPLTLSDLKRREAKGPTLLEDLRNSPQLRTNRLT